MFVKNVKRAFYKWTIKDVEMLCKLLCLVNNDVAGDRGVPSRAFIHDEKFVARRRNKTQQP